MLIKDYIFETILEQYDHVFGCINEDGQVAVPGYGKHTYNQYVGFYLAYLYTYDSPLNPHFKNDELLTKAVLTWEYAAGHVTEDGKTEMYTYDQHWGAGDDEWNIYFWVSAYEILKNFLNAETEKKWSGTLKKMYESLNELMRRKSESAAYAEELNGNGVINHTVWRALTLYRCGRIFGDEKLTNDARKMIERIIDAQHPIGTWYENKALVIDYAEVTLCPLGLFAIYDNHFGAREAARHGLGYVSKMRYGDFTKVLCVDERNRYSKKTSSMTSPTFAETEEGANYISRWIESVRVNGVLSGSTMGLMYVTEIHRVISDTAVYNPAPPAGLKSVVFPEQNVFVNEMPPFTLSFCGMRHAAYDERFNLETQGLLGLYIDKIGAFFGGVHGKAQPQFSLFNIINNGKTHYMHDSCEIKSFNEILLNYGGRECLIKIKNEGNQLTINFSVEGFIETERAYVNLPLHFCFGEGLGAAGRIYAMHKEPVAVYNEKSCPVMFRGVKMEFDRDATFAYPVFPYNSYILVQPRDYADVYGILSIELDLWKPDATVVITAP